MKFVKTEKELEIMREGGTLLGRIREELLDKVKEGVTPKQIDDLAKKRIEEVGGSPSFITVGDYKWATCISVNDGVVHGIPTEVPFKEGDVVGVDVGLLYKGYHTDTSWTIQVKSLKFKVQSEIEKFLKTGETALNEAIKQARPGNRIGHISQAIQTTVENAGFGIVKSLVGHGIGKTLHEAPQVPGVLTKPISQTPLLEAGMTIAIEVIYTQGRPDIIYQNDDGWSLSTKDGSLSGLFEQTVEITKHQPVVLTQSS